MRDLMISFLLIQEFITLNAQFWLFKYLRWQQIHNSYTTSNHFSLIIIPWMLIPIMTVTCIS